jgi:uncharacterized protein (TIGR03435 family)
MAHKIVLTLVAVTSALAQAPAQPTFEVVTIKSSQMPSPQAVMAGKFKLGETIDAGRADYSFVSVEFLITKAYGVKPYQVTGPSWIQSEHYDISAKLPAGATKEQVPDMLKAMLAERFQLAVHHETKEHAVYSLVVAKGGAKVKESAPDPDADAGKVAGMGMQMSQSGDGRGMTVKTPQGNMKVSMGADGNIQMEGSQMPMDSFVEMVSRFVDKPVVDETGLKGKYDITIEMSMADMQTMARSTGMMGMGGRGAAGGGGTPAEAASDPSGGSIYKTLQNLGLKLEPKKTQMDAIVVDKGDKVPTEN